MLNLDEIKKGDPIKVALYMGKMGTIEYEVGGFQGKFVHKINDELIMVYYHGFRPVKIKHCSLVDEDTPEVVDIGGKIVISCIECSAERTIKKCDIHHVKRCVPCQKKYAREQTKIRMRKRRAEAKLKKKNA